MGVGWAETVGVQTVLLIPIDICLCCYKRYEFGATCMTLLASLRHGYKKKEPVSSSWALCCLSFLRLSTSLSSSLIAAVTEMLSMPLYKSRT